MKRSAFVLPAVALLIVGGIPVAAQQLPPIRQLGSPVSTTAEKLGAVSAVRQLSDGRVLVNDIIGRRVLLFDPTLKNFTLVADTTSATANAYGTRAGGLIAYRGDSTLFVDPASLSMLVIDGNGKIARVMSAPRAADATFLVGGPFGSPGFDPQGRLIYRPPPRPVFGGGPAARGAQGGSRAEITMPVMPDSAPLVRVDLATRKLDTLAFFRTQRMQMNMTRNADGGISMTSTVNPLPVVDDWGVLPDGTVALVRGRDYHIDWVTPEKSMTTSPKIPFEWERLSDDAKVAYIDSVRKVMQEARASGNLGGMFGAATGGMQMMRMGGAGEGGERRAAPGAAATPGAAAPQSGTQTPAPGGGAANTQSTTTIVTDGGTSVTTGPGGGRGPMGGQLPELTFIAPTELPDYKPPFAGGATRVDADGNLWIRTTQNVKGLPVYNVVNRKGELIDRVQLPAGRVIAGFGAGATIYLAYRDGDTARLEKLSAK
ncbi:MAG TPA: hypothetical protein VNO75_12205 [Gemmatimonadaceae bacterium]|nr:hypothetical protein [Gemmatimonadaceae bacterium]